MVKGSEEHREEHHEQHHEENLDLHHDEQLEHHHEEDHEDGLALGGKLVWPAKNCGGGAGASRVATQVR